MEDDNGNGRITNAIIMNELKHISAEISGIKSEVSEIKKEVRRVDSLITRVERLEREQDKLRTKSDGWSVLNSIGVFVAGLIAYLSGR
jgi:prefoldin subunit 5